MGIQHAEPPTKQKWGSGKRSGFSAQDLDPAEALEKLKAFDRQFADGISIVEAYTKVVTNEGRLLRQGAFPILGTQSILDHLSKSGQTSVTFVPIDGDIASTGDLAYTYGAFTAQPGDIKGYYSHFWKRAKNGDWKLVIDVTNLEVAQQ
jgi:hypothetical protein